MLVEPDLGELLDGLMCPHTPDTPVGLLPEPEYVSAVVPRIVAACKVHDFGVRMAMLRLLPAYMDAVPQDVGLSPPPSPSLSLPLTPAVSLAP